MKKQIVGGRQSNNKQTTKGRKSLETKPALETSDTWTLCGKVYRNETGELKIKLD